MCSLYDRACGTTCGRIGCAKVLAQTRISSSCVGRLRHSTTRGVGVRPRDHIAVSGFFQTRCDPGKRNGFHLSRGGDISSYLRRLRRRWPSSLLQQRLR